jgi:flagellar biosynthesis protein FlhF
MRAILARVTATCGPDAVVVLSRGTLGPDGVHTFDVIAGDEAAAGAFAATQRELSANPAIALRPSPPAAGRRRARTIALVGPTGAGKTTTLAKLLGHPAVFGGQRVAVVSLDTYRVGATEQLATYAEIAGVELDIVYDPGDLARVIRRQADYDVLLVDTPGRGPRHATDSAHVAHRLHRLHPDEVHLAVPCGLHPALARRIVTAGIGAGVTHLLPTKQDECPDDSTLFDLAAELRLPMRWMTDGQEVPDDLRPAAAALLTAWALRDASSPLAGAAA